MTEKSHVGMAHEVCPVCCVEHTPVPPKGLAFIDQDAFAKLQALEVSA